MREGRARLANLEAAYQDDGAFLAHDMDVVVVANDATEHVPLVIRALEAGRHVLSEVVAAKSLAEAVALARAVERAPSIYSFGENCCTACAPLEMKRLYQAGALGEFIYGECEYVHDCTGMWDRLTLGRADHWRNRVASTFYCTHSLGPVLDITGTHPVSCVGLTTPNAIGGTVGRLAGDMGVVLCQMDNGAVIKMLVGIAVRREPALHWYSIYGTLGQVENSRDELEERVHLVQSGQRTSYVPGFPEALPWAASTNTHGGADAHMVARFIRAIIDGGPPPIDVYLGLDMTLPGLLGYRSACQGGTPIAIPDLRDESIRKLWEDDHWTAEVDL